MVYIYNSLINCKEQKYQQKSDLNQQLSNLQNESLEEMTLFQQQFTPKFIQIGQQKIEFFRKLVNLQYSSADVLLQAALNLSSKIKQLKNTFLEVSQFKKLKNCQNNIILLRMRLKFYSIIMNDTIGAKEIMKQIDETLQKESQFSTVKAQTSALTIMAGNSIYLTGTLLQEPGKLVRKHSLAADFFKYTEHDFQMITNINQLLPHSLMFLHPNFITQFIQTGNTLNQNKLRLNQINIILQLVPRFAGLLMKLLWKFRSISTQSFTSNQTIALMLYQQKLIRMMVNDYCQLFKLFIDGIIDGFSEGLIKTFNIPQSIMSQLDGLHIYHIIPHLMKLTQLEDKQSLISRKNKYIELFSNEKINLFIPIDGNLQVLVNKYILKLDALQRLINKPKPICCTFITKCMIFQYILIDLRTKPSYRNQIYHGLSHLIARKALKKYKTF